MYLFKYTRSYFTYFLYSIYFYHLPPIIPANQQLKTEKKACPRILSLKKSPATVSTISPKVRCLGGKWQHFLVVLHSWRRRCGIIIFFVEGYIFFSTFSTHFIGMIYVRTCWRWISDFFASHGVNIRWTVRNLFCFHVCQIHAGDSGGGLLDAVAKVCAGVNPMEVGGGSDQNGWLEVLVEGGRSW